MPIAQHHCSLEEYIYSPCLKHLLTSASNFWAFLAMLKSVLREPSLCNDSKADLLLKKKIIERKGAWYPVYFRF